MSFILVTNERNIKLRYLISGVKSFTYVRVCTHIQTQKHTFCQTNERSRGRKVGANTNECKSNWV